MAYLCVDKDGTELIFKEKPYSDNYGSFWSCSYYVTRDNFAIELPHGSIAKLIGRELTWEDEPYELK